MYQNDTSTRHAATRGHSRCYYNIVPVKEWHEAMVVDSEAITWEHYTETARDDHAYGVWAHCNAMLPEKHRQVNLDPRTGELTTGAEVSRRCLPWVLRTWGHWAGNIEARTHQADLDHPTLGSLLTWRVAKAQRDLFWKLEGLVKFKAHHVR